jgi:hypothetical protein
VSYAFDRDALKRHAAQLLKDPEFLAEVALTEAAMQRYHETGEHPFPDAGPPAEVLAPYLRDVIDDD